MLTFVEVAQDDRAAYRPYRVTVTAVVPLAPHLTRVTFAGDELQHIGRAGRDQRVKLLFPIPGPSGPVFGDVGADDPQALFEGSWYARWRDLPPPRRNPLRTYTVRAARPALREIDVDFVVHLRDGRPTGPAGEWLACARPGDPLVLVGPDERSRGSATGLDWRPGGATQALLVGDETALPAIASILGGLDAGVRAHALVEVPTDADRIALDHAPTSTVTWLPRQGLEHGALLGPAVERWLDDHPDAWGRAVVERSQPLRDVDIDAETLWDSPAVAGVADPAEGFYAWIAGEAGVVKYLRRLLVSQRGVDRRRVAFMGYWRLGRPEHQG